MEHKTAESNDSTTQTPEIEFRAWDIRRKEMVYNALVLSQTGQLVTVNEDHFNSPFSFFDGCMWMQYTGVKDKNGTKVFQGDILKNGTNKWQISFWKGAFWLESLDRDDNLDTPLYAIATPDLIYQIELIGNIYQNSSLLQSLQP